MWGGYNLNVAWDHKIYTARKTGEATPFGYNRNTHAPRPGGMTTVCLQYLPPQPLYTVCARKGVDNLLNRTLLIVETSGSMKQVHKNRSTFDSGGCIISCMISITMHIFQITDRNIMRHTPHAIPDTTVSTED